MKVYDGRAQDLRFRPTLPKAGPLGSFGRTAWCPSAMAPFAGACARTMRACSSQSRSRVTVVPRSQRFLIIQQDLLDLLEKARTRGIERRPVTSTLGPVILPLQGGRQQVSDKRIRKGACCGSSGPSMPWVFSAPPLRRCRCPSPGCAPKRSRPPVPGRGRMHEVGPFAGLQVPRVLLGEGGHGVPDGHATERIA